MIKADLITGFLGSGKTTFLIKYAQYLLDKGLRIGILEYDYGAVNVDMLLLKKLRSDRCEIEMVAAACDEDCLRRRFKTKLIAMAMSGYDRIIVEPSGVFDMDMFTDTLREEPLDKWYEVGSVIAIVDANLADDLSPEEDFIVASQVAGAGSIVFSRAQLVSEAHIATTKNHVISAAQKIHCDKLRGEFVTKPWDELTESDFANIMNSGYFSTDYVKMIAGKSLSFSSVVFLNLKENLAGLKRKADILFNDKSFGNVIRIKGFIFDAGVCYQLNATKHDMHTDPTKNGQGVVIVIGTALDEKKIRAFVERNVYQA